MNMMYNVCKRTIERGTYPENMVDRVKAFYDARLISEKEYNELMAMLKSK